MPQRIYIMNGHPGPSSISRQAMERYAAVALAAGHEVRVTQLAELRFDPDRGRAGYSNAKPLEPVLEQESDTPRSFLRLAYGDAILRQLKGQILGFCGFKPVNITFLAPASHPKPGAVNKLFIQMDQSGCAGK